MLNFVFTCGQILALAICLYGAYLAIRHGDTLKTTVGDLGKVGPARLGRPLRGRGR